MVACGGCVVAGGVTVWGGWGGGGGVGGAAGGGQGVAGSAGGAGGARTRRGRFGARGSRRGGGGGIRVVSAGTGRLLSPRRSTGRQLRGSTAEPGPLLAE